MGNPLLAGLPILAATSVGMAIGGATGPLDFSLLEFVAVSFFAAFGVLAQAVLTAKEARDKAADLPEDKRPRMDMISLGYSLLAAPFLGSVALAIVRAGGDIFHFAVPAYGQIPAIMAMGYAGKTGIAWARSVLGQRFIGDKPMGTDK